MDLRVRHKDQNVTIAVSLVIGKRRALNSQNLLSQDPPSRILIKSIPLILKLVEIQGDVVFVIKYAQSKGKLDHGMRGPYRVVRVLPHDRYELKLLAASYGKTTYAAAQYMVPWMGEWTPESCSGFFEGDVNSEYDDAELMRPDQLQPETVSADEPVPGPSTEPHNPEVESPRSDTIIEIHD
ncbi:uncharacterized protein LOC125233080 [Leguminivora glycinivorella]|uniref:uncharacterized protein LOC125233080 n=1 Tax=Leguminivora glycinivorella TaxID=1035111 RepID=UPI00200F78F3|nr:uncharacterized protein LOC125233080 [Leguminivora glycinivorella]